jgi:alkanesulfonate monooxygenase SsuD/methylene tetrahydromethanopterin reductase-like flavin-dependent oxidoreductase (luciferase family)
MRRVKRALEFGVAIPQTFLGAHVDPARIRAFLTRAETLGFASAWVVEQILGRIPSLEPVTLLTYAAAVTARIRLGSAVLLTALRSPVHLAKSLASLDHLSGGRLDVGVGLGGNPRVYPAFGLTPERRAARFVESVRVLKDAGRDPSTFPIGKRVYIAVDRDRARAGKRLAEWFGAFYGRPEMAEQVSVWGDTQACVDGLGDVVGAGARVLLLNPVFDEAEQLERFAADIAPKLTA